MCGPAIAGAVIVGAMSYTSAKRGAKAQRRALEFQAEQAQKHAGEADRQALQAKQQGFAERAKYRRQIKLLRGRQVRQMAGSGFALASDSFGGVLKETHDVGRIEERLILDNAMKKSGAFKRRANNFRTQAMFTSQQRSNINPFRQGLLAGIQGGISGYSMMGGFNSPSPTTKAPTIANPPSSGYRDPTMFRR